MRACSISLVVGQALLCVTMKKIFLLTCLALGVVACEKDESAGGKTLDSRRMVSQIEYSEPYKDFKKTINLSYDNLGRVVRVQFVSERNDYVRVYSRDIEYVGSNSVEMTDNRDDGSIHYVAMSLTKGRAYRAICTDDDASYTKIMNYEYDSSGQIISATSDNRIVEYKWSDGNMVAISADYSRSFSKYYSTCVYDNTSTAVVNIDLNDLLMCYTRYDGTICMFPDGDDMWFPDTEGVLGYKSNNYLTMITELCEVKDYYGNYHSSSSTGRFEWVYDKYGAPTMCSGTVDGDYFEMKISYLK